MSPVRPENRGRYPADWPEISRRIREDRAQNMCECRGECGHDHTGDSWDDAWDEWLMSPEGAVPEQRDNPGRCPAMNRQPHPVTGSKVVLTVAHLDHQPEHCADDNLRAMCQRCHLAYDRDHHAATRAATRSAAAAAAGQLAIGGAR